MTQIKKPIDYYEHCTINDRIRVARLALKLSQIEMANKIGVSKAFLSDIENNRRVVSNKTIEKVNVLLGISKSFLNYGKGNMIEDKGADVFKKVPESVPENNKSMDDSIENINIRFPYDNRDKIRIEKQLLLKIREGSEDVSDIVFLLGRLKDFEYILSDLNYYYFDKPENIINNYKEYQKKGYFDYDTFNNEVISEYKKLLKFKPALDKLVSSLFKFYNDISELDEHDITATLYGISNIFNILNNDKNDKNNK